MFAETSKSSTCAYCHSVAPIDSRFCCSACSFLYDLEKGFKISQREKNEKWNYLDQQEFFHGTHSFRILVKGMVCASCTQLLERLCEIDPRVLESRVSFLTGVLSVSTQSSIKPSELAHLIESLGYTPHFLRENEKAPSLTSEETKNLVKCIAVAGFCFGNIMLLAIARYGGLEGGLKSLFSLVEILLFLPIFLYSAQPFYKGAWQSLKRKSVHLDTVISLSLISTYLLSIVTFYLWQSEMYLDSLAAFVFLILIGRWLVKKAEFQAKGQLSDQLFMPHQPIQILLHGKELTLPLSSIQKDHTLVIKKDQILPVDGKVLSPQSTFDTSLINGESIPRVYFKSMEVSAGLRSLTDKTLIQTTRTFQETELYHSLRLAEDFHLGKNRNLRRLDKIGQSILIGSLALSLFALPYFYFVLHLSLTESWSRILSLLVVTCPCALAFGGPLSYAFALLQAQKRGILISNADIFDRLKTAKNIIFDKTGTLTTGFLRLTSTQPQNLPLWQKQVILGLENRSLHPVAFALRQTYSQLDVEPAHLQDVSEVIGERVFGIYRGEIYSLKKSTDSIQPYLSVDFYREDQPLAQLHFEDEIRPETKELLEQLKDNYQIHICSGDRHDRVMAFAREIGLSQSLVHGNMSPEKKLSYVKKHSHTIMLGDGFNDSAALSVADVGIAVEGPLSQSIKNADICFLKPGLFPLVDLFDIQNKLQKALRVNLGFTLVYNLIAGSLSLFGVINPLVAAVLMPLSSLFVLTNAKKGFI